MNNNKIDGFKNAILFSISNTTSMLLTLCANFMDLFRVAKLTRDKNTA